MKAEKSQDMVSVSWGEFISVIQPDTIGLRIKEALLQLSASDKGQRFLGVMFISLAIPKARNWSFDVQGQKKMNVSILQERKKIHLSLAIFSLSKSSKDWVLHTQNTQVSVSSLVLISHTMESSLPPTYTYTEACTQKACMSILTPYKH
jgi:hypothetical protein